MSEFSWPERPSETAFPVAKAGYPFILAGAFVTAIFALIGYAAFAFFFLAVTLFVCFFFRDPDRLVPTAPGAVVSPADGKVIIVEEVPSNPYVPGPCRKISIFMNVFNVHVNRFPQAGTVKDIDYFPGSFFNASLDKASEKNERNAVVVETEEGRTYCMVQIAGLVARRIICYIRPGERLERGSRFGVICFGSRLDVYLPQDARVEVALGDKVKAGTSVLGFFQG